MTFRNAAILAGGALVPCVVWQAYAICKETREFLADARQREKRLNFPSRPIYNYSYNEIHDREIIRKEIEDLTETERKCNFFKNYFSSKT